MSRNPYFEAVEAKTEEETDRHFDLLVRAAMAEDPTPPLNHTKEQVVAGLCYVAGYYGEDTRKRVGRLYSHRSPYRQKL